jgi:hypothetical protein
MEILRLHLESKRAIGGQAKKLQLVLVLGRGWLGRQAFKVLMETVTIWSLEGGDSFITAGSRDAVLAGHFNIDNRADISSSFELVERLSLSFDFRTVDLNENCPFLADFGPSLPSFIGLQSFTFQFSEFDIFKSFQHITRLGTYPPSLRSVSMIAVNAQVGSMFQQSAAAKLIFRMYKNAVIGPAASAYIPRPNLIMATRHFHGPAQISLQPWHRSIILSNWRFMSPGTLTQNWL